MLVKAFCLTGTKLHTKNLKELSSDPPMGLHGFNMDSVTLRCARGGTWCEHRRLVCSLCPRDYRDMSLEWMFPSVPREEVRAWLEAQKRAEERAMAQAADNFMRELGLMVFSRRSPLPRATFFHVVDGEEHVVPMLRTNALLDHVTGGYWVAPASLLLKPWEEEEEEEGEEGSG